MALAANVLNSFVNSSTSNLASMQSLRNETLQLNILDIIKILIIVLMGWLLYSILKGVLREDKWSAKSFRNIKRVGWLSVLVVLLDAISFVIRDQYISQGKSLSTLSSDPAIYTEVISHALFSSPIVWFLIASIFLLADVLNHSHNKAN